MGWQTDLYTQLRDRAWHRAGDLFEEIERQIPLHHATRYATKYGKYELPDSTVARWKLFQNALMKIGVETDARSPRNRKWADRVRLRYLENRSCEACGGPVVRSSWASTIGVACLACEAAAALPKPAPEIVVPEIVVPEIVVPKPAPPAPPAPPALLETFLANTTGLTVLTPRPRMVVVSKGWFWRCRRAFAQRLRAFLPGLSQTKIVKSLERNGNDPNALLLEHGKRPMPQVEVERWVDAYMRAHPP